jgi:tryptophan synthase alpha chain
LIKEKFDELKKRGETALIIYITAGFPSLKESLKNAILLSKNGADIIEIGVPFSDPVADGPTIQYSSEVALSNGVTLKDIIKEIKKIRLGTPLVIMSYLNPLLSYGKEKLFKDMRDSGISGIIIPDLPADDSCEWTSLGDAYDIDVIFLVAPTSSPERIKQIVEKSRGFVYCVSVTGTTGERDELSPGLLNFLREVKQITQKPIAVGFGISTTKQIEFLRNKADGIIIGSRIIKAIKNKEDLKILVRKFKQSTKINKV